MTDVDLLHKKLAYIEMRIRELRTIGNPAAILTDIREELFETHALQTAIQAAIDVAAHIVADERLGFANNNRRYFELLVHHGWLPENLLPALRGMVGFRNIAVHGYEALDPAEVERIARHHLDDLLAFVNAIRERLASE
ncbi:MAG TPA: DUF86 domain-containing protein [Thermoanaerobaculia bacterium]|nr:DUF86 domain-containing protein [Thermoanaerobaculia bacterium]